MQGYQRFGKLGLSTNNYHCCLLLSSFVGEQKQNVEIIDTNYPTNTSTHPLFIGWNMLQDAGPAQDEHVYQQVIVRHQYTFLLGRSLGYTPCISVVDTANGMGKP